jgi:hypothetical protein
MKKITSTVNRILIHDLLGWPQLPNPQPTKTMKATRNTLLLGIILSATASGQLPEEGKGQKPPPPPPPPLVAALDLDRDGRLSAEEIKKAPESLNALDTNGNGRLTEKELAPPKKDGEGPKGPPPADGGEPNGPPPADADAPQGPPPAEGEAPQGRPPRPKDGDAAKDGEAHQPKPPRPHGPSPLLRILDKNGDGTLAKKEINDSAEALLACDADGDGSLTMDELRPKDPPPSFGPGGPPQHGPGPGPGGPPPRGPGPGPR